MTLRQSLSFVIVLLWSVNILFSCENSCKSNIPPWASKKEKLTTIVTKPDTITAIYTLIESEGVQFGKINPSAITQLDEPLKALAAYYSASYGSDCFDNSCELTQALGLGEQGSEAHKALIRKWLPKEFGLGRNKNGLYTLNSSASHFEDYKTLIFERSGDTIDVKFTLMSYIQGKATETKWHDQYKIYPQKITLLKQQKQPRKIAISPRSTDPNPAIAR